MPTFVDSTVGQPRILRIDRGYLINSTATNSPTVMYQGEATFATANSADDNSPRDNPHWIEVPILEDGFSLEATKDVAVFEVQDGTTAAPAQYAQGDDFAGTLTTLLYPGISKLLLDMGNARKNSQLRSFTMEHVPQPNVSGAGKIFKYLGTKCGSYTLNVSGETRAAQIEMNLVAKGRAFGSNFSNNDSPRISPWATFPNVVPYIFKNSLTGINFATSDQDQVYLETEISQISITVNNELDIGPKKRNHKAGAPPAGGDWVGEAAFINSGRGGVTGNMTVTYKQVDWHNHQKNFKNFSLSMMFLHPNALRRITSAVEPQAEVIIETTVAWASERTGKAEFCLIEGYDGSAPGGSPATAPAISEVHQVDVVGGNTAPNNVLIELPGIFRASGVRDGADVWSRALEIYLPQCKVLGVVQVGSTTETVELQVNFSAEKSVEGAAYDRHWFTNNEAIQYQVEDESLNESYNPAVVGFAGT